MNTHLHSPCVMSNTEDFYVRVCGCGVVHLCFGATTLNLSAEAMIAVTETLKGVSNELRTQMKAFKKQVEMSSIDAKGTLIQGRFPGRSS